MKIEEWLGEQNALGIDIWKRKYQYEGESFDAWLDRVSGGDEDVKRLIKEKKFLFGGRILANRGLNKKGVRTTYSNCYVVSSPEDNIESIFDAAKRLARTYSYGRRVAELILANSHRVEQLYITQLKKLQDRYPLWTCIHL